MSIWNKLFGKSKSIENENDSRNKEKQAEVEFRGNVKRLDKNYKEACVGKSQSEKVGLAQVFARNCVTELFKVKSKYGLTEDQAEKISIAVNKDLATW